MTAGRLEPLRSSAVRLQSAGAQNDAIEPRLDRERHTRTQVDRTRHRSHLHPVIERKHDRPTVPIGEQP